MEPRKENFGRKAVPVCLGMRGVHEGGRHVFETFFKGQTGFEMMKAAVEALRNIERLRMEPAYDFGANKGDGGKPEGW